MNKLIEKYRSTLGQIFCYYLVWVSFELFGALNIYIFGHGTIQFTGLNFGMPAT